MQYRQPTYLESSSPFNKRLLMLQEMLNKSGGSSKRSVTSAMQRNKCYIHQNPLKTLDFLRQIVQASINKEIDSIIQHYMQKYFAPAIINIQRNGFHVPDEQIHLICRRILEETKKIYLVSVEPSKENDLFDACDDKVVFPRIINKHIPISLRGKRKEPCESDSESDISQCSSKTSGSARWNPDRLNKNTLFVLGSKANVALGLAAQRGRIYVKHPDLFKYAIDAEDNQSFYENNQKVLRFGRRAFFVILDDILELLESPEYKHSPTARPDDLKGFTISDKLLRKIK
uniref:DNTTIP1 dimerisation domain-containing protein n=1 Tax=Romanomermis culicivorax TaxID=13658 RepID=A0A915KPA0_ROMCU